MNIKELKPEGKACSAPGCTKPAVKSLLDKRTRKITCCCEEHYQLISETINLMAKELGREVKL